MFRLLRIRRATTGLVPLFILAFSLPITPVRSAEIKGQAMDSETGQYLEDVQISLEGKDITILSKRGGRYVIRNLEPGTYTLKASYVGYPVYTKRITIPDPDSSIDQDIDFSGKEVVVMEAFEVTGTKSGQAKAFNQRKAASGLKEIVASDAFGQFVDRNPAEALQRVVGVSVQDDQGEGKFVILRGADPSLNTIFVDGVSPATPEEDGRSTGLNIISIDQLERMEVLKTWSPDKWAHFVGGSVDLVTRSALDREGSFMGLEYAIGKHEVAEDLSQRLSATYSNAWGEKSKLGFSLSLDWSEDNRGSDTLSADGWDPLGLPELRSPIPAFVLQGIKLRDYLITRERVGVSSKLEFELNENHRWYASVSYNEFNDDEVLQSFHLDLGNAGNSYTGPVTLTEERALVLGYDLNDPEIAARVYGGSLEERRMFLDEAIELGTIAYDEATKTYTSIDMESNASKTLQTTVTTDRMQTFQIGGRDQLSDALSIDYLVYDSQAEKDWTERQLQLEAEDFDLRAQVVDGQPTITDKGDKLVNDRVFRISDTLGSIENNRFLSEDSRMGAALNVVLETNWFDLQWETKAGGALEKRDKAFNRFFTQFSRLETGELGVLSLSDQPFFGGELKDFLPDYGVSGDYPFGTMFDAAATQAWVGNPPDDVEFVQTNDDVTATVTDAILKNFEAEEDITALYLMETLRWKGWEFIAGLRWEKTKNTFTTNRVITKREDLPEDVQANLPPSFQFIQPRYWSSFFNNFGEEAVITSVKDERSYDNSLYSLHANRRIGDDWVIRGSITSTLARPKYTALVPREIVDVSGARFSDSAQLPNFELEPMTSVNYDASVSYYFKSFGMASVAVFHKELDGAIYDEICTLGPADPLAQELTDRYFSNPLESPEWNTERKVNAGAGSITGVEISFEKRFTELPAPFDGLGISANATFVDSEVELLAEQREGEKVPLFLQSDTLANVSVFYEKNMFLARLSWVYRGKYLDDSIVAGTFITELDEKLGLPKNALDTWIDDFARLDLLVQYRPLEWLTVFLEGTNITNQPKERYQGSTNRLKSIQYTGSLFSLGAKLSY